MNERKECGAEMYARKLSKLHTAFLSPNHDFHPMLMPLPKTKYTLTNIVGEREPLYHETPKKHNKIQIKDVDVAQPTEYYYEFRSKPKKEQKQIEIENENEEISDVELEEYTRSVLELESECERVEKMLSNK